MCIAVPDENSPPESSPPRTRPGRGPRKVTAQTTKLEVVEDASDPLGPLGANPLSTPDEGPPPPSKEVGPRPASPASPAASFSRMMESVDLNEDAARFGMKNPPPVQPPSTADSSKSRRTQPSVSIEQAAKPAFEISVGDPHKVSDLTSSHIVYQVRTKVGDS